MSQELICAWLGLSAGTWPPDHYTLLGLPPGETDPDLIEQRVHECLERVRRYQLAHPELVTEALNRLAQAFCCLTDPVAKQTYDRSLLPASPNSVTEPPTPPETSPPPPPLVLPGAEASDPLAWLFGPWNVPAPPLAPAEQEPQNVGDWTTAPPPPRLPLEASQPVDPVDPAEPTPGPNGTVSATLADTPAPEPAAPSPSPARRGLGTKRALYYRVSRTRQLLWAWQHAGKYLNRPTRLLTRPAEATELIQLLQTIRDLLRNFPPLLGEAGQPGYLVLALARQQLIVPTFQTLLPSQRQALARDWQAGQLLLLDHRQFLRQELRGLRQRSWLGRGLRTLRSALRDHPGLGLLLVALLALNVAHPPLRSWWAEQLVVLLVLAGFCVTLWWDALRPTKMRRPGKQPARAPRPKPKPQRQAR